MKKYQNFVKKISQKKYNKASYRFKEIGLLSNVALSLPGEVGELNDNIKKYILYGKNMDIENMKEEIGDILFYLAMACNALGISLEEIAQINTKKLKKRYPNGFNCDSAINRKDKKK